MNKKEIPLFVLQMIEPFVNLKDKRFIVEPLEDTLLNIKDCDPNSTFRFQILKYERNNNEDVFTLNYSPRSDRQMEAYTNVIRAAYLTESFNNWLNRIDEYNKVKSFYDDPILESYEAEFFTNFEFVDDNYETHPFKTTQILQLDYLLEQVSNRLVEMAADNNKEEIQSIIIEIEEIRENLATKSQKWIAENISKIYAKIAKQGIKFMKEFWAEGKKEIIKSIVKGLIEHGPDILN